MAKPTINPIKKWLKDNDVGPSELADKIQVRYQTVHAWVTESNTNMGASNIEKVHQVTGIPRDELVKWAARKQLEAEGWNGNEAA